MDTYHESESVSYRRLGYLLLISGILFSLDHFLKIALFYKFWPLFVASTGIGLIGIFINSHRRESVYLALGVYLIFFSALSLFLNFSSWGHLFYLWPLFITTTGFSFLSLHFFYKKSRFYLLSGLFLISLSLVFLVTFILGAGWWWISLVLMGLSVLASEKLGHHAT